jgi:hypothetical protein
MVHYLNANQGFVITLLTAVYVIATVILVALAQRQASLAQKSLDFASRAERAKYRPYVIFDIVYDDVVAYARLKNLGTSPAINVRVSVSPRLGWKVQERGIGFIEQGVSFLAPSRELSEPFGWGEEFFKQYPDLNFSGSVSYADFDGHKYSENFTIGLSYLEEMSSIREIDIGRELEGIRKALECFHSGSFKPLVRTIGESEFRDQEKTRAEAARARFQQLKANEEGPPNA